MPQFTPLPPIFEARLFVGGDDSALEIQGWLLSQNVPSDRTPPEEEEMPDTINFAGKRLVSGQWLMFKDGEFEVIDSPALYTQYRQL